MTQSPSDLTSVDVSAIKRLLVGRPLANSEADHQRINKKIALAVFSSDAISSTAYATEEILFVTALGTSSLALGLNTLIPIGIAVAILLTVVVTSYRQTIFAYPSGGGSYVVSRENLGERASMLAGASLLIDYILTVAVSISAGVAAIVSIPAFRQFENDRVIIGLFLIALITVANLRGLKESGSIFAGPTYLYIFVLTLMVGIGLYKSFFGHIATIPFEKDHAEVLLESGGSLGLFLILKGFASGAVALTGVEAISNGVPAFQKPEPRNASNTMIWMGLILGTLFLGTAILAHHLRPFPSHESTVFSQMGVAVFGKSNPLYYILQFATAAILTLAANTAYADFPRLSSLIAKDGYLPRQFATRGDRLVFSNGILFLAGAASLLLIAFGGLTNKLIPLYAVGVFTSFTLSQIGMVIHHRKEREVGWRRGIAINSFGAFCTFVVLLIVGITKFVSGAWVSILVVAIVMGVFALIKRHYARLNDSLELTAADVRPEAVNHTVVVLVGRLHKGVLRALAYAQSMRPTHLTAVCIADDEDEAAALMEKWAELKIQMPLEIVHSPYRDLVGSVEQFLDELDDRWADDTITVLIPEFVVSKWYENALHNQTALALKIALLQREGVIVTSVPYHVGGRTTRSSVDVPPDVALNAGGDPLADPEAIPYNARG